VAGCETAVSADESGELFVCHVYTVTRVYIHCKCLSKESFQSSSGLNSDSSTAWPDGPSWANIT
jgi:hypothetical protein